MVALWQLTPTPPVPIRRGSPLRTTQHAHSGKRRRWLLPIAAIVVLAVAGITSIVARTMTSAPNLTSTAAKGEIPDVTAPSAAAASAAIPSFWSHDSAPSATTVNQASSVELGMRFQTSTSGTVSGVAFYKDARNTGVHVGSLWNSSGDLLARVTFTHETRRGWQTAQFSRPVTVAADTTYTVSYYAPNGHYSYTHSYFTKAIRRDGLTAPAGNGQYAYGNSHAFPHTSYEGTNYWIDVLFTSSQGAVPPPATTAPATTAPPTTAPPTTAPVTTPPTTMPPAGGTSYVTPGTAGYRGPVSALTVYSAANGRVPANGDCSWDQTYKYLRCDSTNLTLDNVYIQGGLYWDGCGNLTLENSVFDWYPSQTWHDVYDACTSPQSGATITATNSTFETSPGVMAYTGGSDIGGITDYTGTVAYVITHSLIQGFSQGFDPGSDSVIKDNEIYVKDNVCHDGTICHGDGLFSQGGNNIVYEDNYIVVPGDATAAIFYQSSPLSSGNSVIGNYLKGGAYSLYNQTSVGLMVEDNVFAGATYGDCDLYSTASWGTWSGNTNPGGTPVTTKGEGC